MVEVSSADRVVYPDSGTTKGQVIAHYSAVGERMLRHLADRPLTLQRFPRGVSAKGFMQKNAADYFPDYIGRHE
ncbi:MAG: ATP-dependent DNA ligase, partial [Acidimicrobiia bacterium]|nr:ATP-dependent DNA ligase [Acidimicrobiia bacterium]